MQEVKPVPTFKFKGLTGEEKSIDSLQWGTIPNRFHSYIIAVLQALWKLCQLYAINDYGSYVKSNNLETVKNSMWTNCVQIAHRTDHPEGLHASVQDVYFDKDFEPRKAPEHETKRCKVDDNK